jgi:hypothetical protein
MTCLHHLIEFPNMQLAYRHDERPGESYEALDGKKRISLNCDNLQSMLSTRQHSSAHSGRAPTCPSRSVTLLQVFCVAQDRSGRSLTYSVLPF